MIDMTTLVDAILAEHCDTCPSSGCGSCTHCDRDYTTAEQVREYGLSAGAGALTALIGPDHQSIVDALTTQPLGFGAVAA